MELVVLRQVLLKTLEVSQELSFWKRPNLMIHFSLA